MNGPTKDQCTDQEHRRVGVACGCSLLKDCRIFLAGSPQLILSVKIGGKISLKLNEFFAIFKIIIICTAFYKFNVHTHHFTDSSGSFCDCKYNLFCMQISANKEDFSCIY